MARRKIVILGGGVGSLTAAYYLTRTPELRAENDVTVYQLGWRLGGKGASGRSQVPGEGQRIEEHGLHLWFGFYENSFRLMQEIYERKPSLPDDRLVTWRDGFVPNSFTPLGEDYEGRLGYWPFVWPTNLDVPGTGTLPLTPEGALSQLASILRRTVEELWSNARDTSGGLGDLIHNLGDLAVAGGYASLMTILETIEDISETTLGALVVQHGPLRDVLRRLREVLQRLARARFDDDNFRRFYSVLEIGLTTLLGLLDPKYGIATDPDFDLDRIDHLDYREWLLENGADPWVVKESSYLRALYDLPFAYEGGDTDKPGMGAGTAVRILFRIIMTYKEACFYQMRAGMGEVVVAPAYEVLKQQGVKVRFFRKVTGIELSPTKRYVQRVRMDQQVETSADYEPVYRVDGITCWPSEPFWDQIVDGEAIRDRLRAKDSSLDSYWCAERVGEEVLELGTDFDQVVLGITLGGFKGLNGEPNLGDELRAHSPGFGAMCDGLDVVATQAFQLWTKPDLAGLGWAQPELGRPAMNAAPEPFSVWADTSDVVENEQWGPGGPKGVFYFCGPWKNDLMTRPASDDTVPALADAEVKANTIHYLDRYIGYMWPNARNPARPAGLDWEVLYDPSGASGVDRLDFQWIRANLDPGDTCTLSLADSSKHRLKADESGYLNLYMAGAWLRTGINATCVEAATMSGMDCARAICGEPKEIVGEYFCMKKK